MRILAWLATASLCCGAAHAQWQIQNSHATADLHAIAASSDGQTAWAAGSQGTVVHTTDGGDTWDRCAVPPGAAQLDFRAIQAPDDKTAIVMSSGRGDLSRLYKTADGCRTWKLVFSNPDPEGSWQNLQIRFGRRGWFEGINGLLMGDPVDGKFPIFATTDSGSTWRRWGNTASAANTACGEDDADAEKDEELSAESNESFLFSEYPIAIIVFTSGRRGARAISNEFFEWGKSPCAMKFSRTQISLHGALSHPGVYAAAVSGWADWFPEKIMIVGGDPDKPDHSASALLLAARPNARHLPLSSYFASPQRAHTPPHGFRSAVDYDADTSTWITVGPNGTDISRDDGRTWIPLQPGPGDPPGADRNWTALSLPYAVGPGGRIGLLRPDALRP